MRWLAATLLATQITGCMTLSLNQRPRALGEGDVRIGTGWGMSREVYGDFRRADAPTGNRGKSPPTGAMAEVSFHYGIVEGGDIGVRVRPLARGAKVESMIQIIDSTMSPVELALAPAVDFAYRERTHRECGGGWCISREYAVVAPQLHAVGAWRVFSAGTLFASLGYTYLHFEGDVRLESQDPQFADILIPKSGGHHVGSWTLGFEFNLSIVRLTPMLHGFTYMTSKNNVAHDIAPALDFAFEW